MDVTVTDGPFGRSVKIIGASSAQFAEVWAILQPAAPVESEPEEGRAYVGQVIPARTQLGDWPPGVKLGKDDSPTTPYIHLDEKGHWGWTTNAGDPVVDTESATPGHSFNRPVTVLEVW